MTSTNRRGFLSDVGRGMLAAGVGAALADDLGFGATFADEGSDSIPMGSHESLVDLMRSTPPAKLQPLLARKVQNGEASLKELMSAGALANAITFGGCDYVGFHTAMAMLPAVHMSSLLGKDRAPLPVLKVLYRNAAQIQSVGGASETAMRAMHAAQHAPHENVGTAIREACREMDSRRGEQLLAGAADSPESALNALQPALQDDVNVHRFVMAHRTYGLVDLLGQDYCHAMLRQCVRFCVDQEKERVSENNPPSPIRALLPKLLDQYKLEGKPLGKTDPGDEAIDKLSQAIYRGPSEQAAEAVAAALAEGIDPEAVGEAIALASNLYVLRQGTEPWRVHGASAGVHSSDATNAWRNMARVVEPEHAKSGLIVAAYYANIRDEPFQTPAYPTDEHRDMVKVKDAKGLLAETEDAIRQNEQGRATAAVAIYGGRGYPVQPVFDLMLKYAVSEDGRLHAEKYFQTVCEEYQTIRPAFRWRQMVGLARVTASEYGYNANDQHGYRAPGYQEACHLLGVKLWS